MVTSSIGHHKEKKQSEVRLGGTGVRDHMTEEVTFWRKPKG